MNKLREQYDKENEEAIDYSTNGFCTYVEWLEKKLEAKELDDMEMAERIEMEDE